MIGSTDRLNHGIQPGAHGSGCAVRCASVALIEKLNAAGISVPPHHATMLCRFEAIQRQIKFEGGSVMRR